MSNPSQTPPLFAQSCRDIIKRLDGRSGNEAQRMRRDAESLLEEFTDWFNTVPDSATRTSAINRLLVLYREVLDFCSKK